MYQNVKVRNWNLITKKASVLCSQQQASNIETLNAFQAAGGCRRQVKTLTKFVKNVEIVEFHDHIWSHHEKCIQKSTNMPGIGSWNRQQYFRNLRKKTQNQYPSGKSVNQRCKMIRQSNAKRQAYLM